MSGNDLSSGGDGSFESGSTPDGGIPPAPAPRDFAVPAVPAAPDVFGGPAGSAPDAFGMPAAPDANDVFGVPAKPAMPDVFGVPASSGPDAFGMPAVPDANDVFGVRAGSAADAFWMPAVPVPDAPAAPVPDALAVPDGPAVSAKPPRRLARIVVLTLLVAVGLAGVGGGAAALARELTRPATKAEQAAAVQEEIDSRWQRLSAGKIFTPTLGYSTSDFGANMTATLVGIAPPASCATALDPALATVLRRYGCVTVLRATYLDYSGSQAVTVGIVVMNSAGAANGATSNSELLPDNAGVRTFSLPATLADQFGDAQRRYFSAISSIGTYLFLAAAGYTDGRVSGSASSTPSLIDLGTGVLASLQSVITAHGSACAMKDIRC